VSSSSASTFQLGQPTLALARGMFDELAGATHGMAAGAGSQMEVVHLSIGDMAGRQKSSISEVEALGI
jgi:hypothetical protein